jgi:hypothetical protein
VGRVAAGALAGAIVLAAVAVRPSGSAWLALFGREKTTRGGPEDEHLL